MSSDNKARMKRWHEEHKAHDKEYAKKYNASHKKEKQKAFKAWYKKNGKARNEKVKKQKREYSKKRYEQNKEKIKIINLRWRHPERGFVPLNSEFEDSRPHHINNEYVVYIPKRLHEIHKHSLNVPESMKEINWDAFKFLMNEIKYGEDLRRDM